MQNCQQNGKLVDLNITHKNKEPPWLLLPMKLFHYKSLVYPVMVCPVCMLGLEAMSQEQNPKDMVNTLCKHTKCAQDLIPDWKERWEIPLLPCLPQRLSL